MNLITTMIKKIEYVDYGYMPSSLDVRTTDGEVMENSACTKNAYFRVGWKDTNRMYLAFYSPEEIQNILNKTECLSLMNLIGREVEIETREDGCHQIVNFLK